MIRAGRKSKQNPPAVVVQFESAPRKKCWDQLRGDCRQSAGLVDSGRSADPAYTAKTNDLCLYSATYGTTDQSGT